eukprot:CAMPEP_0172198666 /NCGR_PEP_ID=MMETSP1050-20130122/28224_1 /TAXON_ID=233186 /ORGANISM="Cryptomonas curvata, Strain CCAP979/52" /LENGTH=203 /DNA_ID=CAMNT_0012875533 /DNA_START=311 /DNA_END=921 /DNA_ORIENTATION=-
MEAKDFVTSGGDKVHWDGNFGAFELVSTEDPRSALILSLILSFGLIIRLADDSVSEVSCDGLRSVFRMMPAGYFCSAWKGLGGHKGRHGFQTALAERESLFGPREPVPPGVFPAPARTSSTTQPSATAPRQTPGAARTARPNRALPETMWPGSRSSGLAGDVEFAGRYNDMGRYWALAVWSSQARPDEHPKKMIAAQAANPMW